MLATDHPLGDFNALLRDSAKIHGHLCPGQVLGVRMALLGLKEAGVADPKGRDRKHVIVFVEMDRCATDAIQSVSGCSLGRRTMKFVDYGKMAATFVNLRNNQAVRVVALEEARQRALECFPGVQNKYAAQLEAYAILTDEELFRVEDVDISLKPEDMPGRPVRRVRCARCGEYVQDAREVCISGDLLCRACAGGGYYLSGLAGKSENFFEQPAMQNGHNAMEIRSKLWIEIKGEPVFGRGRRLLLEAIDRSGSISQAAKEVNISYRRAWSYIKAMEERLSTRLVERQSGGKHGGGATLTGNAREFLKRYAQMEQGIREMVDERFRAVFSKDS